MGLEKAKSLLDLKEGRNFLDFIALQAREEYTRVHESARDRAPAAGQRTPRPHLG